MSINRILAVVAVMSLLVVAGLTLRSAVATSAVISGDHSYDQIEHQRALTTQPIVGDYSYDEIEHIRADRDSLMAQPDLSGQGASRQTSGNPMPTMPFGPGIAATYGASSERIVNTTLPFGPGWAATYGVPAH